MVKNGLVLRHYHKTKNTTAHAHKDAPAKLFMDKAIFVIGVAGPIMTVPQLLRIWLQQDASGVSWLSWLAYSIFSVFWLVYGLMHKEKPIIVTYIAWILVDTLVFIGALLY